MQQFKAVTKNCVKFFLNTVSSCFGAVKYFCKNVIAVLFLNIVNIFKRSPRALAALITVVLVLSCTVTVVLATNTTSAYAVMCNGEKIAMVKDPSVLAEAEIFAANKLNNPDCTPYLIKTELMQTIAGEENLISSSVLAERIINKSEDIVMADILKVDGEEVAVGKSCDAISSSINAYLASYKQENGVDNVGISNDYQIIKTYALKSEISSLPMIENYLNSSENVLSLQTVSSVVVTKEIPFETVKTESNVLSVGTNKVVKNGEKGLKEITYRVYSLNGVETKRIVESEKIISKPVSKEIAVGTKRVVAPNRGNSGSMHWPVKRVEGMYVSSYVGDGRGHKGMDIVAPASTPIYAATGGTVTFSGWDSSGYGYKIVVKHSNGFETLYAHCSALYVKKGDVVAKGEHIAAVGTTGRSTGNHLHFEVHQNGSIKDPANYIGRN